MGEDDQYIGSAVIFAPHIRRSSVQGRADPLWASSPLALAQGDTELTLLVQMP
jgi:hypothetical protein